MARTKKSKKGKKRTDTTPTGTASRRRAAGATRMLAIIGVLFLVAVMIVTSLAAGM